MRYLNVLLVTNNNDNSNKIYYKSPTKSGSQLSVGAFVFIYIYIFLFFKIYLNEYDMMSATVALNNNNYYNINVIWFTIEKRTKTTTTNKYFTSAKYETFFSTVNKFGQQLLEINL